MEKNFEKNSLQKDCGRDKNELLKMIEKLQVDFEKQKKKLKQLDKKLEETSLNLETKVDIEEHSDLKELILKLPKVEDVEK